MTLCRTEELERIANVYHLNEDVPDKFIEDLCQEHICNWLCSLINTQDRVVELGYGEGITAARLAHLSEHYSIVEGAPSLVKAARETHHDVIVVDSLFENYSPTEKFDKLLALHVFEHVDEPVSLAKHLRSWLKPNGEIIVVVPNKGSLHRRLALSMGLIPALDALSQRDRLVGHQRVYDAMGLEEDLRNAGFRPFERRGFFLKPLPNSMMLEYDRDLIRAMNLLGDELPVEMAANVAIRAFG